MNATETMNSPQSVSFTSRKLKKSASGVLASFRPSTYRRRCSEGGVDEGVFPFAKIHSRGERPTRSAVCTSSDLHSLRPCWTNFLSILQGRGVRSLLDFAPWAKEMGSLCTTNRHE